MSKNDDLLDSNFAETPVKRTIKSKSKRDHALARSIKQRAIETIYLFWRVLRFAQFIGLSLVLVKLLESPDKSVKFLAIPVVACVVELVFKYWVK